MLSLSCRRLSELPAREKAKGLPELLAGPVEIDLGGVRPTHASLLIRDRLEGLAGEEGLMGSDDHVREGEQPHEEIVLNHRAALVVEKEVGLLFVNVEAEAADLALLEPLYHRAGVDQPAPAGVDQHRAWLHQVDSLGVDQMVGGRQQRAVEADDAALLQEFIERQIDNTPVDEFVVRMR